MAKISLESPRIGNQHPRQNFSSTATLGSLNAEVIIDCDGCNSVSLDLRSAFVGTIELSGTIDGTNWILIPIQTLAAASRQYASAATVIGAYMGSCSGFARVRARMTAFTSGAATTVLLATNAIIEDFYRSVTPTITTAVGATAAAVTLTLAAPGVGLRHYINKLRIERFATALLTAAAVPVTVTTTNLAGLIIGFPAEAAPQGTLLSETEDFSHPLAAAAQNTATTFVAPATTGVIWRITAFTFLAP